jgi:hypothetical protein
MLRNMNDFFNVAGDLLSGKVVFSGNSDQNFTDGKFFDNQLIDFYCQNLAIRDLPNALLLQQSLRDLHSKFLIHFESD